MPVLAEEDNEEGLSANGIQEQNGRNPPVEEVKNPEGLTLTRSNREERLKVLKERQNEERLKKLEELKQNALQAAKIREEQDSRRRKHFEEIGKKEDERRRQAEERRRVLDEERKASVQSKWEAKKVALAKVPDRTRPIFAFGSCTPRLVDNLVDGCLWKSQYNLNTARELHVKSTTSAQDLHSQIKMSTSMYEWNQQRTTLNLELPREGIKYRKSRTMELDPDRVFCGRRKTDLTPTFPIRREDGSTSRSTSRAGTASAGTRSGNATPSSRPPSSMSSLMTSSTHSQVHVQMRPRTLASRKSRPVSVHVTGVSLPDGSTTPPSSKGAVPDKPTPSPRPPIIMKKAEKGTKSDASLTPPMKTLPRKKVESGETKPKSTETTKTPKSNGEGKEKEGGFSKKKTPEKSEFDTSTIKRAKPAAKKKELIEKPVDKELEMGEASGQEKEEKVKVGSAGLLTSVGVKVDNEDPPLPSPLEDQKTEIQKEPEDTLETTNQSIGLEQQVEIETVEQEPQFLSFVPVEADNHQAQAQGDAKAEKLGVHFDSPTPPEEKEAESSDSFSAFIPVTLQAEVNGTPADNIVLKNGNPFGENLGNPFAEDLLISSDGATGENLGEGRPKLMTEEDAKAALADKRRLAREAQERELVRLEEEARLEEERQRLEVEEAERLALAARGMEEERLRVAIEEQNQRELEEKKKREEEELARQEREKDEREAAREAERVRLEMEERLKREEEERLERKKRVEAIMSRTRKGQDSAKATTPVPDENPTSDGKFTNGIQHEHSDSPPPTVLNNLNNYNNNNDFSNTLIDFGDMSSSPTPPPQSNNSTNLINTSLQDLLS